MHSTLDLHTGRTGFIQRKDTHIMEAYPSVLLENRHFRLTVGGDAIVESLVCKETGEELAAKGQNIALCSVTQNRPFHNEVKLAHPNKRTTYQANRIRMEGDRLIVGFEIIPYEAVVRFAVTDAYIAFSLDDFLVPYEIYGPVPSMCFRPRLMPPSIPSVASIIGFCTRTHCGRSNCVVPGPR